MPYSHIEFAEGDALLFGAESRGLPADFLNQYPEEFKLYLPMRKESRSLNLSNTVSIVLYEAWKQLGFGGAALKQGI